MFQNDTSEREGSLKGTARIQRRGDRKDAGICLGGKIPEIKGIRYRKATE